MAINNSEGDTTPPPLRYNTDGSRMCLQIGKVRDFYEIYNFYVTIFCMTTYFGKKLIKSNESFVKHMYVWSNSN